MNAKDRIQLPMMEQFCLNGKVAVITGGAGLLGIKHAEAVAEAGGIPILWDIHGSEAEIAAKKMADRLNITSKGMQVDIKNEEDVQTAFNAVMNQFNRVDILINNAANNPKFESDKDLEGNRLENFNLALWQADIEVGLTGAFLCSKVVGSWMAENGGGVILNVASDLGVIAPDQRIYRREDLDDSRQPVKPVTYSVIKHGIIGLTKYLATYWADHNVRANAISPGGVHTSQEMDFVKKLSHLIPLGRMATPDEYKAAVVFLVSDASAYMTGANLIMDGGRSVW